MSTFRVALSSDFKKPDGTPAYPMVDLGPLVADPDVECVYVDAVDGRMPAEALAGCDALILLVPKFDRASIPANDSLAVVARFGVGFDSVEVAACSDTGVAVTNTPDGVRRPVAASILTLVLALSGKLFVKDKLTRTGPAGFAAMPDHMGLGLIGRTLGSVGMGNIGAEMFRLFKPLDMRLIAHDPYVSADQAAALGVTLVDLETVFRESDYLAMNTPLTDETRKMVNRDRLALMKPTAFLINTSRGPVVDQPALVEALTGGVIAGAAIDVFDPEPPAADEPLLALDNVIVTPHALCWTDQCFAGIGASAINAVLAIKQGTLPTHLVDRTVADSARFQARLDTYRAAFGGP